MRKYAREISFSLVFEYLFTKQVNELELDMFEQKDLTEDDKQFIKTNYNGVLENFESLQSKVADLAKGFKLDRIYKVDLAVLMLAIYEMSYTDLPPEICINEAVELAKKFSTDKSVGFVNGILAEYFKQK